MAEAGHPVSELYPQGGLPTDSMESTLSESLFAASSRSSLAITPSRLLEGPSYACQEEAVGVVCKEHSVIPPTREANCSNPMMSSESGAQEQGPNEHCVTLSSSRRPHSLAETHILPRHHVIAINDNPPVGRAVQTKMPASLPVHRSHSDTLPLAKQRVPPLAPDSETHGLACHEGDTIVQEAENSSRLACKQPMQLQQCNIITTICRGANSVEGSVQHPQSRCVYISSPKAAAKVEGVEEKGQRLIECSKELCYGCYIHPASFEDTFAAFCHPQPIPSPSQLLPRLADVERSCDIQHAVGPPSANHLALPRLISSVSETGLDAKHLLQCCNYSWISSLPPGTGPSQKQIIGGQDCCSSTVGHIRTLTRDMGTMTTHTELRDVGVQTGQIITPHVFPHICLAEDSKSETSNTQDDEGRKPGGPPKSPVKEVKWDAEGMTWEVYGASVDPEELGLAIQRHLELQIKETANHAAKLSHQNTNTSRQRGNTSCQRKRTRMMGSIRTPACCTRTTTAVD